MPSFPNAAAAVVSDRKLSSYLLSATHPEGAPKARFFESFGFSRDDPEALRRAPQRGVGQAVPKYGKWRPRDAT